MAPKGQARIRVQLSAAHEKDQPDRAIEAFAKVGNHSLTPPSKPATLLSADRPSLELPRPRRGFEAVEMASLGRLAQPTASA